MILLHALYILLQVWVWSISSVPIKYQSRAKENGEFMGYGK